MKTVGIVAFAFGTPESIMSNRCIAQIASQKARDLEAPVYTQLDIHVEPGIKVEYTEEKPGNPPPTLRIARGAVQWAKLLGFRELWIVAAMPHLWRAIRDVHRAVRENKAEMEIVVYVCYKEIGQYPEEEWFCPDSMQDRTCSRKAWDKREKVLKLIPFFLYKLIAS